MVIRTTNGKGNGHVLPAVPTPFELHKDAVLAQAIATSKLIHASWLVWLERHRQAEDMDDLELACAHFTGQIMDAIKLMNAIT